MKVNPDRPETRKRFSIGHEITHTFFPDHASHVWPRAVASKRDLTDPDEGAEKPHQAKVIQARPEATAGQGQADLIHGEAPTGDEESISPEWAGRVEDHAYLCEDPSLRDLIERADVQLIGYRRLRELQRAK